MQMKEQSSTLELSSPLGVAIGEREEGDQEDTPLGCRLFLDVPLGYAGVYKCTCDYSKEHA